MEENKNKVNKKVEAKPPKVSKVVKVKSKAKVFNVQQFCNLNGVQALEAWVAKRFFPSAKDKKSMNEWKKIFEEKKIAYKK